MPITFYSVQEVPWCRIQWDGQPGERDLQAQSCCSCPGPHWLLLSVAPSGPLCNVKIKGVVQNATGDKQPGLSSTYSPLCKGTRWHSARHWPPQCSVSKGRQEHLNTKERRQPGLLSNNPEGCYLKRVLLPLPFPSTSMRPGHGRGFSHHLEFPREKHCDIVQKCLLIPNSLSPPSPVRKPWSGTATANTAASWSWELLTGIAATFCPSAAEKGECKVIAH